VRHVMFPRTLHVKRTGGFLGIAEARLYPPVLRTAKSKAGFFLHRFFPGNGLVVDPAQNAPSGSTRDADEKTNPCIRGSVSPAESRQSPNLQTSLT
jgi:hypothetical protein